MRYALAFAFLFVTTSAAADSLLLNCPGRIVTPEAQTIRFYGVVPEPASWLLVLIVHLSLGRRFSALTRSR